MTLLYTIIMVVITLKTFINNYCNYIFKALIFHNFTLNFELFLWLYKDSKINCKKYLKIYQNKKNHLSRFSTMNLFTFSIGNYNFFESNLNNIN